jgi:adenylate cyclase class 2
MAVEIEAKLKVPSHDPTRQKLRELGATSAGTQLEINTFFDTADRSLLAADKGLRLRVTRHLDTGAEQSIVTFKGPRQPGALKSREESETHVSNPDCMMQIFRALGYEQVLTFEKKRESWHVDDCHVELDEVPHLGTFVEIEGPSEAAVSAVQEKLELASSSPLKGSYVGMLMTWLQERGSAERIVTFPRAERE